MSLSVDTTVSPLNSALARSRSRYKGSRPRKTSAVPRSTVARLPEQGPQVLRNGTNEEPRLDVRGAIGQEEREMEIMTSKAKITDIKTKKLGRQPVNEPHPRKAEETNRCLEGIASEKSQSGLNAKRNARREENVANKHTHIRKHMSGRCEPSTSHASAPITSAIPPLNQKDIPGHALSAQAVVSRQHSFAPRQLGQPATHRAPKSKDQLNANRPSATNRTVAPKPAFDAPVSAINTKERRVTVKYGKSVISIPVTPSTTSVDVIRDTGSQLSNPIRASSMVLLESFRKVGLERPLRKYERIRDVLNSWDDDAQNALILVPSPRGGRDDDLDLNHVARQQPGEVSLQLHHSQRLGCWDKRWITLRADGQVFAAKKEGVSNICHLSDFDIYVPTKKQMSRKVRPPKKICFAIKSQQKSSMFLSTENFVHFFCTNDKDLATQWYKAVQEWRSWYLVHVLGEGQKAEIEPQSRPFKNNAQKPQDLSSHDVGNASKCSPCGDQSISKQDLPGRTPHYHEHASGKLSSPKTHSQLSKHYHGSQPISSSSKFLKTPNPGPGRAHEMVPSIRTEPEPFATTGLLGRAYTQRKKAQQERDEHAMPNRIFDLNKAPTATKPLARVLSQRPKQNALVDLTPQYQEPPQHRKGKGIVPDQIPAGGLVEVATSPEQAISIPPAMAWQRPPDVVGGGVRRSDTVRTRNHSGSPRDGVVRRGSSSPEKIPFISGLLASGSPSQGGVGHGRGVRTGDRDARIPMIDRNERSRYLPGSLLAGAAKQHGKNNALTIDRERKREIDVIVGEGL